LPHKIHLLGKHCNNCTRAPSGNTITAILYSLHSYAMYSIHIKWKARNVITADHSHNKTYTSRCFVYNPKNIQL